MKIALFFLLSLATLVVIYKIINKYMLGEDKKERIFLSLSYYFVAVCLILLLLVIFENYSFFNFIVTLSVLLATFILLNIRFQWISIAPKITIPKITRNDINSQNLLFTLLVIIGVLLYSWFPTEYIIGGRDQGVYVSEAVLISETGSLQYEDEFVNQNYKDLANVIELGYPGFYSSFQRGLSDEPGDIVPQFLPLFPSLLALSHDLFGFKGLFRLNALIGLMAVLSIYFFSRRLFGSKIAILAAFLVMINPAEIWNARITQTELLSQFLFFFSMYLFIRSYRSNQTAGLITSGFMLGLGCFNRVDSHLFGLGVLALLMYIAIFNISKLKSYIKFFASYIIVALASIAYGFARSFPYFDDLWKSGSLSMLLGANLLLVIASLILVIFEWLFVKDRKSNLFRYRKILRFWPAVTVCILFALFIFAYFIRPNLLDPKYEVDSYEHFKYYAMREFTWYVPIIAILLSFYGLYFVLKKRSLQLTGLFIVISLASIVGYIYDPSITPDHLWASRRWITVNIPTIIIFFSVSVIVILLNKKTHIKAQVRNIVIYSIVLFIIVFSLYQSKTFLFQAMLKDYSNQFQQLANALPDDSIIVSTNKQVTTTLKFVFNKNAYTLLRDVDESKFLDFIKNNSSKVYSINWSPTLESGISSKTIYHQIINGNYVEKTRGSYPKSTYNREFNLSVSLLTANPDKSAKYFDILYHFYTKNGQMDSEGNYISNGTSGFLLYGPYIKVEAGTYKVIFDGNLENNISDVELGFVDVTADKGQTILNRIPLTKDLDSIKFSVEHDIEDFEFRIYINEGVIYKIKSVILQKV